MMPNTSAAGWYSVRKPSTTTVAIPPGQSQPQPRMPPVMRSMEAPIDKKTAEHQVKPVKKGRVAIVMVDRSAGERKKNPQTYKSPSLAS